MEVRSQLTLADYRYAQTLDEVSRRMLLSVPFPIYYNFLHGIELCLKAYLMRFHHYSVSRLKCEFGHDLSKLLNEAVSQGLRDQCSNITDNHLSTINELSDDYLNKDFEYHSPHLSTYNIIENVESAADAIVGDLTVEFFGSPDDSSAWEERIL